MSQRWVVNTGTLASGGLCLLRGGYVGTAPAPLDELDRCIPHLRQPCSGSLHPPVEPVSHLLPQNKNLVDIRLGAPAEHGLSAMRHT